MSALPDHDELQSLLDDACRRHRVPGAVIGIAAGGERVVVAHGVRNVNTGDPMTTDTVAQVASVTKIATATVVLQVLAEHGVDLETPVADVVPELAGLSPAITFRRLLDHTSGIESDLWDDAGANDDAIARFVSRLPDLGSLTEPGAFLSYCNTGYVALGRTIEVLTGKGFERVVQQRLLAPLGMARSSLRLTDAIQHAVALGHDLDGDGRPCTRPWIDIRALRPTGGLLSTVPDLLVLGRAHLDRSTDAVPASIAVAMATPSSTNPEPWTAGPGWGLGLTVCTGPDGVPVVGHDGLWIGAGAYVRLVPSHDLAIAMTGAAGHARAAWKDVSRELLGRIGLTPPALVPAPPAHVDHARYVGRYRRLSQDLEVHEAEGGLVMTTVPTGVIAATSSTTSVPLVPAGDDVFTARAPTGVDLPVVFLGEPGPARYLHTGMRAARRVSETPA
ncbi:MAG: serine hydrolase domain-containing protein [Ilumatobacteraceae bacterium]